MVGIRQKGLETFEKLSYNGKHPEIDNDVFIASGVKLIGDVRLKKFANVWYNSVLRGDINFIEIGEYTNIQDLCLIHVTKESPTIIGKYVTVGHGAVIHACNIKDNVLIGMKAVILDNAEISENCLIAAGSVVTPNYKIPPGVLVAGVPAKIVRDLKDDEIQAILNSAHNYVGYANEMKKSLNQEIL